MTLENLEITIHGTANDASQSIYSLTQHLAALRSALGGDWISNAANSIRQLGSALSGLSSIKMPKLDISEFQKFGKLNLSSIQNFFNQISQFGEKLPESITKVSELVNGLVKLDEELQKKPKDLKNAGKEIGKLGKNASSAAKGGLGKFFAQIKRIAVYRLIRFALSEIVNGFKEGTQNLVQFSAAMNGLDSSQANPTMSAYLTKVLELKNALGASLMPTIQALLPVFNTLANVIIRVSNAFNQFTSAITGKSTWTRALEYPVDAAENWSKASGAVKEYKNQLLSFDEINRLDDNSRNGSAGGAANLDATQMFETDVPLAPWAQWIYDNKEKLLTVIRDVAAGIGAIGAAIAGIKIIDWLDNLETGTGTIGKLAESLGLAKEKTDGLSGSFKSKNENLSEQNALEATATEKLGSMALTLGVAAVAAVSAAKAFEGISTALNPAADAVGAFSASVETEMGTATDAIHGFETSVNESISNVEAISRDTEITFLTSLDASATNEALENLASNTRATLFETQLFLNENGLEFPEVESGKFETSLENVFQKIKSFFKRVGEAFSGFGESLKDIEAKLGLSDTAAETVDQTFGGKENLPALNKNGLRGIAAAVAGVGGLALVGIGGVKGFQKMVGDDSGLLGSFHADGGSVRSASLFWANENGNPELVGQFGSNAAVMNQNQIVDAVAQGVATAVAQVMNSGNKEQSINVYLDGQSMAQRLYSPLQSIGRQRGQSLIREG